MQDSNTVSPTGRLTDHRPVSYFGSFSMPVQLTPKQRAVLASMVDGKVTLYGREFTREQLYSCFKGEQLPKEPAVCEALDVAVVGSIDLSNLDYSNLELRILASGLASPDTPYGPCRSQRYVKD